MSSRSRWFISLVFFSFIILMNALSVTPALAQDSPSPLPKRIVADYGYWSRTQDPPYGHEQIPYHKLTHINHAGVSFNADGSLSVPDGFLEPELNKKAHDAGVKVMLLLGGDFNGLETSGAVEALVDNIAAFEQEHHYDGVDMDWEYPASTQDGNFFVKLMKALRESNPDYTLSIDVPPWGAPPYDYAYDLKHMQLSLDYFNLMMYDCAGPWTAHGQLNAPIFWDPNDPAPYECQPGGSDQETADIFLKHVPAAQLNMGTPFYGYHYTNINQLFGLCPNAANTADGECDNTVLTVNYAPWVKDRINKNGWYTQYDPIALVPYMLRTDGKDGYITYDDAFSTYYRVWYSDWKRGLGGTFMWSLDADYDGHSQDLLDAMYWATVTGH
ncbi:Glycoside hydrolase, family 18 [Candidatus Sulfotelmatobacter kueseliae]|uniref:chitinase n=1 Tax=Candidatus Sulfotelmatobacter kueseliae TaxID=2042962 RepID=A0A2U3KNS7_9BACT|nr:Glycoside hydrolase, family 18 [Candidatus Sulfotelmatobacter kueseliae]